MDGGTWIVLDVIGGLCAAGMLLLVSFRRPQPAFTAPLVCAFTATLLYALGDIGTLLARDLDQERAALVVLYSGTFLLSPSWWWLAVRFASPELGFLRTRLRPWLVRVPFAFAASSWLAMATNGWHGAFITPVVGGRNEHHVLWHVATTGLYLPLGAVLLLYALLAVRRGVRAGVARQARLLLVATSLPFVVNLLLYQPRLWPWTPDPTIVVLGVSALLLAAGAYGGRLFGLSLVSLRTVLQHGAAGVVLFDEQGRVLFANRAAEDLFEMSLPVDGKPLSRLAGRLLHAECEEPVSEAELHGQARKTGALGSGALYRIDGHTARWVWLSWSTAPGPMRGEVSCMHVEDVTRLRQTEEERGRLEQRIERSERLDTLGSAAASVVHDMRDLLATVRARAELGLKTGEHADALSGVIEDSARGERLMRSVLRSLIEPEAEPPAFRESANGCVLRVRDQLQPFLEENGGAIELSLASHLPEVAIEPERLEQALENLVRNALGVGGPRTRVRIATRASERGVQIEVSDDGPGFDAGLRTRLFEPLFSARAGSSGTGLGLTIVRTAIERVGGAVDVGASEQGGARVTIDLPA